MNEKDIVWIDKQQALTIHSSQLTQHGGSDGIRDERLLESALAKPHNPPACSEEILSPYQLAASYAFGIARNHPFVDGNKRTALVVCFAFLLLNGIMITAPREDRYFAFYDLAAGKLSEDGLAQWLAANSAPVSK